MKIARPVKSTCSLASLRLVRGCAAALLAAALAATPAGAVLIQFAATIDGAQETPPNGSPGMASGTFTMDTVADTLSFNIVISVPTPTPEILAHIHGFAPPGVPAPILFPLPLGSPKVGVWNFAPGDEANIIAGLTYVNIHSQALPGGEIRGQILRVPSCGDGTVDPGESCDPPGSPCDSAAQGFVCDQNCACTPPPPDHFQCYELKPAFFSTANVTVQDQFGTLVEGIRFPHRLCNPANKNDEGIIDPTDHLAGYTTKAPPFTKRRNQTVVDQFGTLLLDVTRPDILLVPTSKDGVAQQPPLDHFQCYKIKRSRGGPKFVKRTVSVSNQFETVAVTLVKPYRLCAPANKNGEDPTAPSHPDHLTCYKTKDGSFAESTHTITNQFGLDEVRVIHRRELCVPSLKNPPTTTTTTSTTTTVTTSTTTSSEAPTTTVTTSTSTTTTTMYGSPSRAFLEPARSLLD